MQEIDRLRPRLVVTLRSESEALPPNPLAELLPAVAVYGTRDLQAPDFSGAPSAVVLGALRFSADRAKPGVAAIYEELESLLAPSARGRAQTFATRILNFLHDDGRDHTDAQRYFNSSLLRLSDAQLTTFLVDAADVLHFAGLALRAAEVKVLADEKGHPILARDPLLNLRAELDELRGSGDWRLAQRVAHRLQQAARGAHPTASRAERFAAHRLGALGEERVHYAAAMIGVLGEIGFTALGQRLSIQ